MNLKPLILNSLNFLTVIHCTIFRVFFGHIYVLRCDLPWRNSLVFWSLCAKLNIFPVNFEDDELFYETESTLYRIIRELSEEATQNILEQETFPSNESSKIYEACFYNTIFNCLGDLGRIELFRQRKGIKHYTLVFPRTNFYVFCKNRIPARNIALPEYLEIFGTISKKVCLQFFNRFKGEFERKPMNDIVPKLKPIPRNNLLKPNEAFEVAYYPHQGVLYGNLFVKDYYYSEQVDSKFSPQNLLHFLDGEDYSQISGSLKYYQEQNVSYVDIAENKSSLIDSLVSFFKLNYQDLKSPSVFILKYRIFYNIQHYRYQLRQFPNLKALIAGFDILFPPALAFVCKELGITTIGAQERFLCTFSDYGMTILDKYFTISDVVKSHIESHNMPNYLVKDFYTIGPIRNFKFGINRSTGLIDKYLSIASKEHLCLVLDFHSCQSFEENRLAVALNHKHHKIFYNSIIELAKSNQDTHFVIKGKFENNFDNPKLREILREINECGNISIIRDHDQITSYELGSIVNSCIALHTSLADEIISLGKPVLFYDICGAPTEYFDYLGYPIIVKEGEDLEIKFQEIKNSGEVKGAPVGEMARRLFNAEPGVAAVDKLKKYLQEFEQTL